MVTTEPLGKMDRMDEMVLRGLEGQLGRMVRTVTTEPLDKMDKMDKMVLRGLLVATGKMAHDATNLASVMSMRHESTMSTRRG